MSTKEAEASLGIGAKVGIVAAVVLLAGIVLIRRNPSEAPPPPAPEVAKAAPRANEAPPRRVLGQRFNQPGESDSGQERTGNVPAVRSKLDAQPKSGAPPQRPALAQNHPANQLNATDSRAKLEKDPEDIPSLRKVITSDPDPERRLAAVTLLGISDNPEAIGVLAQALSDEDENVRMEAVLALADFTDEAPVEVLADAMNDPSAEIRYEALDVLSDIETSDAKRVVQAALSDPDEDVREQAQMILDLWDDDAR